MQNERKIVFDFGEVIFRKSPRSKTIRIKVHPSHGVVVSIPTYCSEERAINFVIEKELWIRKSIAKISQTAGKLTIFDENTSFKTYAHKLTLLKHSKHTLRMEMTGNNLNIYYPDTVSASHEKVQEFIRNSILKVLRIEAKRYLPERTRELAHKHGLKVNDIKVRNNKTRWGSCSGRNNINLNIHLMRLSQEMIDYVILHELAHVKVKNHSAKYWVYLESLMPGARIIDKKLNKQHLTFW